LADHGEVLGCGKRGKGTSPATALAVGWVVCVLAGALAAGWLPVPPPDQIDWTHLAVPPGTTGHLLGTDGMGRDILSRLLFGARVSLVIGAFAPCIGLALGCLVGIGAGFYRGLLDKVTVAVIDSFLAFPRLVFMLMTMTAFGSSVLTLTLALGFVCFPSFARVARAGTLRLADREYVLAARAGGASDASLILGEILPNVAAPMAGYLLLVTGAVIVAEAVLGFVGLSVPAPAPSWGGMIREGREVLEQAPHVSLLPSLAMFLTILAVNLIGERLRKGSDVRESQL
jgi:peptide/nickel transport system permease protein